MPAANDELLSYIARHERLHGAIPVPESRAARDARDARAASELRQSLDGSPREWGLPVAPQPGATQRMSAKVALGLGTPHTSPSRGPTSRSAAQAPAPATQPQPELQPAGAAEAEKKRAPTPPRESRVVAAARIALASPAPSVPTEVLLGAYRWQQRAEAARNPAPAVEDDISWHSSAANLMDVLESPVSLGSSFTMSNPLADASTEGEAIMRDMTEVLSGSELLASAEASPPTSAESSRRKQRQRSARRKQRSRAKKAASEEALETSDSSIAPSTIERSTARKARRRSAKKNSKPAQKRAAKIRAIVKEAREDRMLRPDLRCSNDELLRREPRTTATDAVKPLTEHVRHEPADDEMHRAAALPTAAALPAAVTATTDATSTEDKLPQQPATAPLSVVPPTEDSSIIQANETQLEIFQTIGEYRDRRDDTLRRYVRPTAVGHLLALPWLVAHASS